MAQKRLGNTDTMFYYTLKENDKSRTENAEKTLLLCQHYSYALRNLKISENCTLIESHNSDIIVFFFVGEIFERHLPGDLRRGSG